MTKYLFLLIIFLGLFACKSDIDVIEDEIPNMDASFEQLTSLSDFKKVRDNFLVEFNDAKYSPEQKAYARKLLDSIYWTKQIYLIDNRLMKIEEENLSFSDKLSELNILQEEFNKYKPSSPVPSTLNQELQNTLEKINTFKLILRHEQVWQGRYNFLVERIKNEVNKPIKKPGCHGGLLDWEVDNLEEPSWRVLDSSFVNTDGDNKQMKYFVEIRLSYKDCSKSYIKEGICEWIVSCEYNSTELRLEKNNFEECFVETQTN